MSESIIQKKAFLFAVRIVRLSHYLQKRKNEYVISKQVLKSGTSISANIEEALGACSKRDFIAKMTIVYKESRETNYWINLLKETELLTPNQSASLLKECEELMKMSASIIITSKQNQPPPPNS
jgi:four helix bundle protein